MLSLKTEPLEWASLVVPCTVSTPLEGFGDSYPLVPPRNDQPPLECPILPAKSSLAAQLLPSASGRTAFVLKRSHLCATQRIAMLPRR